ncbi:type I-E CRISPR-associated protein Cse2/CasB [Leekyejoonella antrihumi]|uniref:Type I-E CRISPR-associated protein Cse2/CasB n=1 Tax=Leekyejoonella antrihumi TaxID=1660198 RepID=A0A563DRD0_9MICO|nr:type I-E CRISPR-associated protein Cse2/CasB [Leekyejoonella antrihumi]TWP32838.1 type I-E CRISPR-associated protein Cse2/CasB [Leekyejoonella antrihumi]
MTAPTTPNSLGAALIGQVLARRDDPGSAGWCASVRRAITSATEVAAYGYTEPHLLGLTGWQAKVGARRAAAICAGATGVKAGTGSLGRNLAELRRKATADSVDAKVNILPMLDVENAAGLLAGLVTQCGHHGVGVNFYALADTLARWGEGLSPASQRARQRIVADYYSAPTPEHTTQGSENL